MLQRSLVLWSPFAALSARQRSVIAGAFDEPGKV